MVLTSVLFGVSLPLLVASQPTSAEWTKLTPSALGFSVLMPGTAKEHEAKVQTKAGQASVTYFLVEDKDLTFVVSCANFPKDALKAKTNEKRLDNARDGAIESADGKLQSEKAIKLGRHPGRELLIEGSKAFVRTRIYAVENKLYQTMAVGSKKHVNGADAGRFFESFELVK
jgi:hypothetical protein